MADVYTITSSSNKKLDFRRDADPNNGAEGFGVDPNNPPVFTHVPVPGMCEGSDAGPNCVTFGTMFGNTITSGTSDKDISECIGGNNYDFGSQTFNHSCNQGMVDMDRSFKNIPMSRINSGAPADQTYIPDGNSMSPVTPSVSSITDQGSGDPYSFNLKGINKLFFNVSPGTGPCGLITSNNGNDRCNEIDQSFSQNQQEKADPNNYTRDFNISFSINSLVDDEGKLIGAVKGKFRQEMLDRDGTGDQSDNCEGTFEFKADTDNNGTLDGFEDNNGDWIPDGFTMTSEKDNGTTCQWGGQSQTYRGKSQN